MYLDVNTHNWSWTALYMNSHNFFSVPLILLFLIQRSCNNWANVIVSYGVDLYHHKASFLIWGVRDIDHEKNHRLFNNISCSFFPEGIPDHYSSFIEISTSNDIICLIATNNVSHVYINECMFLYSVNINTFISTA